jgi:protein-tyrosine phosphatase
VIFVDEQAFDHCDARAQTVYGWRTATAGAVCVRRKILFVCHANLCRSPIAERVARHAIARLPGLRELRLSASSGGTHAATGMAMHPVAYAVLAAEGIDADGFASRPLSAELLNGAGLVLTAARRQRAACATLAPAAVCRTFTLRQFGRLAEAVDPDRLLGVEPSRRLSVLVDEALSVRGELAPAPTEEDELADPVGGTLDEMRACLTQIRASLSPVLDLLAGTARRGTPAVAALAMGRKVDFRGAVKSMRTSGR